MAGSDEAPENTQKRAEGHSHLPGVRQHKRPQTPCEHTIGRRDSDQTKNRIISERLRRQHCCSGRYSYKLGTMSPAALWTGQGATCPAGEEAQSRGRTLPSATTHPTMVVDWFGSSSMTAEQRLAEVGQILAAGIRRISLSNVDGNPTRYQSLRKRA